MIEFENIKSKMSMNFKFHHVACAVKSISKALEFYTEIFGFKVTSEPYEVPSQKVKVCFLDMGDKHYLELVEGMSQDSQVNKILERPGGGVYHICYEVEDIDKSVSELRKNNFLLITRFEQKDNPQFRYAFLLTPDRHVFELCELYTVLEA